MANGTVPVTPGAGKNVATYEFTEDAATKQAQRIALNSAAGVDLMGALDDVAWNNVGDPASLIALYKAMEVALLAITTAISANTIGIGTAAIPSANVLTTQFPISNAVSARATFTSTTAAAQVLPAAGASVKNCVTTIICSNSSATATEVDIRDGTAGTVLMTIPVPANTAGAIVSLPRPLVGSANTIMAAQTLTSVASVKVTMVGFTSQ